jgi:RNA polymerase sigma factor (sigma-70 family)
VSGPRWAGSDQSRRTAAATRTLRGSVRFAGRRVLRTQTDQRLVELARRGSEPAFETIVERYRGPLRKYSRRFVPASRVDDVLQQTFFDAYRAIREEGRNVNLRPWLFRVTHNVAVDTVRQEGRAWNELSERPQRTGRDDPATEKRESLRDLLSSLQRLPEQQRAAIVLREMEGRSYEEISRELGVTESAVAQLLARARHRLQAGASTVLPAGVLLRVPGVSGSGTGERVAELVSAGGAAVGVAKAVAVLAVAGAVGGTALTPSSEEPTKAGGHTETAPVQPFVPKPLAEPQVRRERSSDSRGGRAERDRSKRDRAAIGRARNEGRRTHGVVLGGEPLRAPEDGPDDDAAEPGAEVGREKGPDADDGDAGALAPSATAEPENHTQDAEPVNDVEPVADVEPDLDPGD